MDYNGTFDAAAHTASGTATGVSAADLSSGLTFASSYTDAPGGSTAWSFAGGTNYNDANGTADVNIAKATSTTDVTVSNATYDGTPHGGTANATGAGGLNEALTVMYAGVSPTVYASSATAPTAAGTYTASASYSGDANHNGSSDSQNFTITPASTETTVMASAGQIRYMDSITLTAKIVPLNMASPITGTVEFKIGDVTYATSVPVVPIPDDPYGSVQAMLITQVANLPSLNPDDYIVKAIFTSSNVNYSDSESHSPKLKVIARTASPYNATGFYAGDLFAWTTGPNTSTATVTMTAVIKDENTPKGDVRGAKVSFYFVNNGIYTPISSAQNLPVGLVDITDGSVGTASAIVQLNIGSANADSFHIAVGITGGYENVRSSALSQSMVTVSKPVGGGYICGGSQILNTNSSGYIKGHKGLPTNYGFDIQYTKSGTNPKGKAKIIVNSYNKADGILDSKLHTYIITTNAIASLNVATSTGTFSAKANLTELLSDGTTVAIEGGSTFQMVAYQSGSVQKIAITLYRKAGGIWFSSSWDGVKTVEQSVCQGSMVYVSGGGSAPTITAKSSSAKKAIEPVPFNVVTYPNPTKYEFTLVVEGGSEEKVGVLVYDVFGKMVKQIDNSDGQQISFGEEFPSGAYIAIVSQGTNQKTIKLIKQ